MPVSVIINKCSIADLEKSPTFEALLAEYGEEAALEGMSDPSADMPRYRAMERTGAFHAFGAFDGDNLIGFVTIILSVLPHYGRLVAVSESYFVAKEARRSGAGIALKAAAENYATQEGAKIMLITAAIDTPLDRYLTLSHEYSHTHNVHTKVLG